MYQRGMDGINTEGLSGLFDTIQKVASGVIQGADAVKRIGEGSYTPYPGSTPVLYGPPPVAPQPVSSGVPTGLLLGGAAILGVVLVMMRRGRR